MARTWAVLCDSLCWSSSAASKEPEESRNITFLPGKLLSSSQWAQNILMQEQLLYTAAKLYQRQSKL